MVAAEAINDAMSIDLVLRAFRDFIQLQEGTAAEALEAVAGLLEHQQAELAELLEQRHGFLAENQRLRQELARWRPVATIRQDRMITTFRVCVGGECQEYQISTQEYRQMGTAVRYVAAGAMLKGLYQAAVAAIIPTEVHHV